MGLVDRCLEMQVSTLVAALPCYYNNTAVGMNFKNRRPAQADVPGHKGHCTTKYLDLAKILDIPCTCT